MKRLLILLLVLIAVTGVYAQKLELKDAINIALKNSLDIELARNYNIQRDILNSYGMAGGLPVVAANASDNEQITNINQKYDAGGDSARVVTTKGANSNTLNAGITGTFLLFNGMRVVTTKKRLDQLELQSEQYINSQVQNIIAMVMTNYYDVVRQQYYIRVIDQSIDLAKQTLDIVKAQQSVGLANNANLYQAQLDLNNLVQAKEIQQLVIQQAKTEMLRLLTLKTDSTINIQDTIIVDQSIMLDAILSNLTSNADIIAADQQVRINELIVRETAAQRYPSVSVNGGYNYARNQNAAGQVLLNQRSGPVIGLGLSIPIYNGSIFRRQQKAAEIDVKNAELQKGVLVRDYTAGAVKSYQAYSSTIVQLETARQNFKLSQDLVSLVLQRFQLRQATILEVSQAQDSFERSAYVLINLAFSAKSSEIELKRLSNQLVF